MKKLKVILSFGAALLASANSGPLGYDAPKREPGLWKTEITLVDFKMPGWDEATTAATSKAVRDNVSAASGEEECVTAEQAENEDLTAFLRGPIIGGGECTWSKMQVTGGKIDALGKCADQKVDMSTKIAGSISPAVFQYTNTSTTTAPGGKQVVASMRFVKTLVGPCERNELR